MTEKPKPETGPRIFSPEFSGEVRSVVYSRAEIAITILVDGALLFLTVVAKTILLRGVRALAAPGEMDWSVKIVDWVLNFGLVGTVIIITGFDLLKRIRNSIHAWRDAK